jgi:hypothetical protein
MKKTCIVAPVHIQVSDAWSNALLDTVKRGQADVIIVDDSDGKVILPKEFDVYGYARQKELLGDLYPLWQQFQKSAACKNFGTWRAFHLGYENIIVIDSDCIVPSNFVHAHLTALNKPSQGWDNPLKNLDNWYSRGFPYHMRNIETWAHMGLWTNELDLYGTDRIGIEHDTIPTHPVAYYEQTNATFPWSGMSVAFKREAIPFMMFFPNFNIGDDKIRRCDDIWGGYIFQWISRLMRKGTSYGAPYVHHDTVVVPEEDAEEELGMIKWEEAVFDEIDYYFYGIAQIAYHDESVNVFQVLSEALKKSDISPLRNLASAFEFWAKAFDRT